MEFVKFRSSTDVTDLGTCESHSQLPLAKCLCWVAAEGTSTELGITSALQPCANEERTNSMADPSIRKGKFSS